MNWKITHKKKLFWLFLNADREILKLIEKNFLRSRKLITFVWSIEKFKLTEKHVFDRVIFIRETLSDRENWEMIEKLVSWSRKTTLIEKTIISIEKTILDREKWWFKHWSRNFDRNPWSRNTIWIENLNVDREIKCRSRNILSIEKNNFDRETHLIEKILIWSIKSSWSFLIEKIFDREKQY